MSNPLERDSGGFVFVYAVIQQHEGLVLVHDRASHEGIQELGIVQVLAVLQEVAEVLCVERVLQVHGYVALGAVALGLELGDALFGTGRDDALLDGAQDVCQALLRLALAALRSLAHLLYLAALCPFGHGLGYGHALVAVAEHAAQLGRYSALDEVAAHGLAAAGAAAVVLVLDAVSAVAGRAGELAAALGAADLAGERVGAPVLPGLVLLGARGLDGLEGRPVDDGGHAALDAHVAPLVYTCIFFIVEHCMHRAAVERLAVVGEVAPCGEVAGDRLGGLAVRAALEGLAHGGGQCLVDDVLAIGAHLVAPHRHAVRLALQCVALHATLDAHGRLAALACRQALEELLVDDALGAVWDGLQCGDELHAVLGELALVDRRVVRVAAEAVHHVDEDDVALPGARDHLLELGAVVCAAAHGAVRVLAHDGVALALAPLAAHAQLVVDGRLALLAAAEACVDNGRL